jgi:FKBP-type peptidyl-prolyl cis-trans isomerase FklB
MRDMLKAKWLLLGSLVLAANPIWAEDATVLKTDHDKLSYSIGASIGKNLKTDSPDVDLQILVEAMKASLSGQKLLMEEQDIHQVMNDYQTQLRQKVAAKRQKAVGDNQQKGETFLADYKKQPGVQLSPGGVLYKILKAGSGKKPVESDLVEVNYRGTLSNGTQFDATEAGKPASLKVAALIPGWKQALTMMPVGSKWQIVIPSALGYGERGVGSDIGPNEVLVFEVDLVAVK